MCDVQLDKSPIGSANGTPVEPNTSTGSPLKVSLTHYLGHEDSTWGAYLPTRRYHPVQAVMKANAPALLRYVSKWTKFWSPMRKTGRVESGSALSNESWEKGDKQVAARRSKVISRKLKRRTKTTFVRREAIR